MYSMLRYRSRLAAFLLTAILLGAAVVSVAQERQGRGSGQGPMRHRAHSIGPRSQAFMHRHRAWEGDGSAEGRIMDVLNGFEGGRPLRYQLTSKLEEGLAKNASLNRIAEVLERQRDLIVKAVDIVAGAEVRSRGENGMTVLVAMALESGVEVETLEDLLRRTMDMSRGAVMAVISATEIIRLNDIDQDLGMAFIEDCIERKINRPRILAGVNMLARPEWRGKSYEKIREDLWLQINAGLPHVERQGGRQIMRERRSRDD